MNIQINNIGSTSTAYYFLVDTAANLDKIESTFDCYSNNAIQDEIILDTSAIYDCEEATATAISIFGEEVWNEMPLGLVLFHN